MDATARFVRFVEPTEGSFSLTVPAGWPAQAGVVRDGSEARPWYRLLSPGGGAEFRGSDPRVPLAFIDPSTAMLPVMPMPGLALRPYAPPRYFAEEYARHFARESGATSFQVTGHRDVEALLRDDPRPATRPRLLSMLQMGADFAGVEFALPGQGRRGIVDVLTLRVPSALGLRWSPIVTTLVGPAAEWEHVKATLLAICRSYETSPAWQQMQSQASAMGHRMAMDTIAAGNRVLAMQAQSGMEAIAAHAQRARIAAQANAASGDAQMAGWRAQQASGDEQQRRAVNAVRETVDVYDPATGQVFAGAPAGFATWWTDGADRVVGSTGQENPDAARFHRAADLDDVPPGARRR
ncbi:MAG: uncharacterized protein JWM10_4515 [Myxococcaceae bacterium]|nr:uncharacterized protein [Myxococcaceae bacterium]